MNNTHEILMFAGPALLALAYVVTRIQTKSKWNYQIANHEIQSTDE